MKVEPVITGDFHEIRIRCMQMAMARLSRGKRFMVHGALRTG
jgi:hypothetical protein